MSSPIHSTFGRLFKLRRASVDPDTPLSDSPPSDSNNTNNNPSHSRGRASSVDPSVPRSHRSLLSSLTISHRSSLDSYSPKRLSADLHFPSLPIYPRRRVAKSISGPTPPLITQPTPSSVAPAAVVNTSNSNRLSTASSASTPSNGSSAAVASTSTTNTSLSYEPAPPKEYIAPNAITNLPVTTLSEIASSAAASNTNVHIIARIAAQRRTGSYLSFLIVRDSLETIQVVLRDLPTSAIRWLQRIRPETLVSITGILVTPPIPIRGATIHNLELRLMSLRVLAPVSVPLPFDNYLAPESLRTRMTNRVVDLRHPANIALFKVRAMALKRFREVLDANGFMEINTPKLQPAATESGAEVFKVNYFGRRAFLAQSPQLAKQMAIGADFGRVYEIGPVFRAENSNTHRHLTEYTGLDVEMILPTDHYALLSILDTLLKTIIHSVQSMPELAAVRTRWPSTDIVITDETPIIPFIEGIRMLREDGADIEIADLSTKDEIRLGELVKAKYGTDLYVLDKFPASARPFYAQRVPTPEEWTKDPEAAKMQFTNGFDIFLRGQEICSGGQRINDAPILRKSMRDSGIAEAGMEEYLSAFDAGAPPHGGAGFGLERILMLLLELGDIRYASLFYRDPKSLPTRPPVLPHPNADTTKQHTELPPLTDLIANYGDSTNTSWLDDRFEIWRHTSGAAVGFVRQGKLAIITGNPLCDSSQYTDVIHGFLTFIKTTKLTPIWLLVSETVQNILASALSWRSFTCTDEQRVDSHHSGPGTSTLVRKARRVTRSGIKVHQVKPTPAFRARADPAIAAWMAHRKGRQIHLTEVRPWVDMEHRRYFAAETDGQLYGLVVLARLAPRHGWQVKWALDFPGAANGSIEVLIEYALAAAGGPATFGAAAATRLQAGHNLKGAKVAVLGKTYATLVEGLGLWRKSHFREKFGIHGEKLWICYPGHGVGILELKNMIKFFEQS